MTSQPPTDPRSRNRDLGFDEFMAIFIALSTIGAILWWGLTRTGNPSFFSRTFERATDGQTGQPGGRRSDQPPGDALVPLPVVPGDAAPVPSRLDSPVGNDRDLRQQPLPADPDVFDRQMPTDRAEVPTAPPQTSAVPVLPLPAPIMVAPPVQADTAEFSDLPADYWALPFISRLSERGIMAGVGDGSFQPDRAVTRAEYAALLDTILPADERQQAISFSDVGGDYWASAAINEAVRTGFLKGYPDQRFVPEQPMTRLQAIVSLTNGIQRPAVDDPAAAIAQFTDSRDVPNWAVPVVASAVESNMVVNYPAPEQLNPDQPITRAEVAALVHQALVASGQLEAIPSDYIVRP